MIETTQMGSIELKSVHHYELERSVELIVQGLKMTIVDPLLKLYGATYFRFKANFWNF